jgi:hypothetical protein
MPAPFPNLSFILHPFSFRRDTLPYGRVSAFGIIFQMIHEFDPGDFLVFQLESGYALLRVLGVDIDDGDAVWHVAGYRDFFLDTDMIDAALENHTTLVIDNPHLALTNRAFESTQVAKMRNVPLTPEESRPLDEWRNSPDRAVHDRSVRLLLGLR